MLSSLRQILWWSALCSVQVYLCLVTLPAIARKLPAGWSAFPPIACLLIAAVLGHLLVVKSKSEDCWREATLLGLLVYAAIIVVIAVVSKAIVVPVPFLFVIPGCALGGLLRWHELQSKRTNQTIEATGQPQVCP